MKKIFLFLVIAFSINFNLFSINYFRAERDFGVAVDLFKQGDNKSALFQFQNFIANYSGSSDTPLAIFYSAECLFKLEEYDSAIENYKIILTGYPKFKKISYVYLGLGYSYFAKKNFDESRRYFTELTSSKITKEKSIIIESELKIIETYFYQKKYEVALENCKKFLQKYPNDKNINYIKLLIGKSYFYLKKYNESIEQLQKLKTVENVKEEALYFIAYSNENINKTEEAKKIYNELITKYKNYENINLVYYNLAWLYFQENNLEQAKETFSKITGDKETIFKDAKFRICQILFLQKKEDESLESFKKYIDEIKDYQVDEANYFIALIYFNKANFDKALEYINNVFTNKKSDEKFEKYFLLKLKIIYKLNKFDEIISMITDDSAVIKSPENIEAVNYYYAKALYNLKKYDDAAIQYINFISKFENSKLYFEMKKELADIYFQLKRYSDAMTLYADLKKRKELISQKDEITYFLGLSYYYQNLTSESVKEFKEIISDTANSKYMDDALLLLSEINFNNKEYKESLNWSEKIIKSSTKSDTFTLYYAGISSYYLEQDSNAVKYLTKIIEEKNGFEKYYKSLFYRAASYFRLEKYADAQKDFNRIVTDSNDENLINDAMFYNGLIEFNLKKYKSALNYFKKVNKNYLSDSFKSDLDYYQSLSYYNTGDYINSYQITRDFAKQYPKNKFNSEIAYINCLNLYYLKRYDDAARNFKNIIKNPNNKYYKDSLYYLVKISLELNKIDEGLKYSSELIKYSKYEKYYEAILDNAKFHFLSSDYEIVIKNLDSKLSEIQDESLKKKFYFMIGKSEQSIHNYLNAIENYKEILKLKKNNELYDAAMYNIGFCYFKSNHYKDAIAQFEELLNKFPDSEFVPESHLWIGKSYFNLSNFDKCIDELKKVLDIQNREYVEDAIYTIAVSYFNISNYNESINYYKIFLEKFPSAENAANAKYGIGLNYKRLNNFPEFIKNYEELIKQYPDRSLAPAALFELGKYFYENKNFKEAVVYYKRLIDNYPKFDLIDNVIYELGTCEFAMEEFDKAKVTFEEFLKRNPDKLTEEKSFYFLGNIYFVKKDYAKSIEYFSKIRAASNLIDEAKYKIGISYYYLANYKNAIQYLKDIPKDKISEMTYNHSLFIIGNSFSKLNDDLNAIKYYSILFDNDIEAEYMPYITRYLFNYYLNLKEHKKALPYLNRYISKYKNQEDINDVIFIAAKTSYIASEYESSKKYFKYLLDINDEKYNAQSLKFLSEIYLKEKNSKDYIEVTSKLVEKKLYDLQDLVELSNSYLKENNREKSIEMDSMIVQEFPNSQEAIFSVLRLGEYFYGTKSFDKSIEYYQQFLDKLKNNKSELGAEIQLKIGTIYYTQQKYQEAIIELNKVKLFKPKKKETANKYMEEMYYYIIKSYIAIKETDKAKSQFQTFKKEFPKSKYITELNKEISTLKF